MAVMDCWNCPVRRHTIYRGIGETQSGTIFQARRGLVTFRRGQIVGRDREENPFVYTLVSGWAHAYVFLADGRRQILEYYHPGDLISLPDLIPGGPLVSTRALTDIELCQFDKDRMLELLESSGSLVKGILSYVNSRRRMAELRMIQLGAMSAEEAIVSLILEFYNVARRRSDATHEFVFPLRLGDIAETLGITDVHAGRVMRALEAKNAIWRKDRYRLKIDEQLLRSIIRGAESDFSPAIEGGA